MSESDRGAHASPVEMLAAREGPAVHEPGVLFGERQGEQLAVDGDAASLAARIAVPALSSVTGNSAPEAIKAKVLEILSGWRRR